MNSYSISIWIMVQAHFGMAMMVFWSWANRMILRNEQSITPTPTCQLQAKSFCVIQQEKK